MTRFVTAALLGTIMIFGSAGPAAATWSVVAADPDTGAVGGAIASCVDGTALSRLDQPQFVFAVVPGVGVGVSTGQVNPESSVKMDELLRVGDGAVRIVEFLNAEEFDDQADARQHAVVRLDGGVAASTGENTVDVAADAQSDFFSIQGDSLVSADVVTDGLDSWNASAGEPLEDRLLAALVAGSEAGGDRRCDGQTALFAQVFVADRTDEATDPRVLATQVVLRGDNNGQPAANPVAGLAETFATGERQFATVPDQQGRGALVNAIGAIAAVVAVGSGIFFWRYAYRKPRY